MQELIKKLQDEIAALEMEFRVELPREILKARAHGDLKENAEYHAAKERQGIVNARLNQLNGRLREISMIDMTKLPRDRAGLCSEVIVLDVDKDIKVKYTLVTSEEVDVAKGLISTSSPIGRSLLGKQVGDEVRVTIEIIQRNGEHVEVAIVCCFQSPGDVPDSEADQVGSTATFPIHFATSFGEEGVGGVYVGGVDQGHCCQGRGLSCRSQRIDEDQGGCGVGSVLADFSFGGHQDNIGIPEQDVVVAGHLVGGSAGGIIRDVFDDAVAGSFDRGQ